MRLIDADAAIDTLNEQIKQCNKALGSFDISLKDEYAIKVERASLEAYKEQLENLPTVQLGTNLAEVGTNLASKRTVKGFPIDADLLMLKAEEKYGCRTRDRLYEMIRYMPKYELPSIQPERKMGHWICESKWSDTMGTNWNTWKCDQCNVVAAKGWEHTRDGMKPKGKFCSECGTPMNKNVIFISITEKE